MQAKGDYIVMAADSLLIGVSQVSTCKVEVLGNQIVFAMAGVSGSDAAPQRAWDSLNLAKQEYAILARHPDDNLIEKLAIAFGKRYAEKINRSMLGPGVIPYLTPHGGNAGEAIFAGFNRKHQRVIVEVEAGVSSTTRIISSGNEVKLETQVLGYSDIAKEYATNETERSKGWLNSLKRESNGMELKDRMTLQAERVIELTAKYHPDGVGGPTDEVLVTRNHGVRWTRRNAECEPQTKEANSPHTPSAK